MEGKIPDFGEVQAGWLVHKRVVGALLLREMRTRYSSSRLGFAWALIEPLSQIALLSMIWLLIARHTPLGSDIVLFIATGVATFTLFKNMEQRVRNALSANSALLAYPIVKPIDFFIARFALENSVFLAVVLTLALLMGAAGFGHRPADPLGLFVAGLTTSLFGFGLGVTGALIFRLFPGAERIYEICFRVLYFVSGVFFLPDPLPIEARDVLVWNPVLHAIAWVRDAVYPGYASPVLERTYLISWTAVFLVAGLLLERRFRGRVMP